MNTIEIKLTELLTGDDGIDSKLRAAYELGLQSGRVQDREGLKRNIEIETTKQLLAALMRTKGLDLQTAMVTLAIPKKDRKTYTKIFAEKARQKQTR